MSIMEERIQAAIESVLENERMAEDLDSEPAELLTNWALELAENIARSTEGMDEIAAEEAMYPCMRAMRQMMRAVKDWVVDGESADRPYLLDKLARNATIAYRKAVDVTEERNSYLLNFPANDAAAAIRTLRMYAENQPIPPVETINGL